jgi:hypothetical protein
MLVASCYRWVPAAGPVPTVMTVRHPGVLRVHTDSTVREIYNPTVVGDSLSGDNGYRRHVAPVSVALARITGAEVRELSPGRTFGLLVGGAATVVVAVLIVWGLALGGME